MIDRRDIRVLVDGWYTFRIEKGEENVTEFGPGVKLSLSVVGGAADGGRMVVQADRVATPGNKLGRLFRVIGIDPGVELPVDCSELRGRIFGGLVRRYDKRGRVSAKVVEFCLAEKVREKVESYSDQGR